MFSKKLRSLIAIVSISMASFTQTALADDTKPTNLPKALETLRQHEGFVLKKQFKTDADGIDGYLIETKSGKYVIVYGYKDFLISGVLVAADGQNLSDKYAQEYIPKPDYAAAADELTKGGFLVSEGKKGLPELYVFADPNCYFCNKFWKATRNWVSEGKVRIDWAMVGFLKKSSPGRAAAIMAAKDSVAALSQDEQSFDLKKEEGGLAVLNPIPEKYKQALSQHAQIMGKVRFNGTPGIIYKDTNGKWHGIIGMPEMDKLATSLGIK